VVINSSDDTKYQPCVGPNGSVPININIQCSFSPLSYDSASDIFGKGVAQKLNRLNQLGFSVTSTEIPKGGAIALVAFIPADTLGSPKCFMDKTTTCSPKQKSHYFQQYKGSTLQSLFQTMTVAVAGVHVQQVTPSAQPTLKLFINPPSLQDFSAGVTVTIEGSGFDTLKGVELVNGGTVIIAKLQPLPNASSTSIDPNVANLVIPATPVTTAGPGKYEINFILADGTVEDATQSITIPIPPMVSAAVTTPATFALIPSGGSFTLQLTGTNLTQITAVALQGSGAAIPGTISATATGQITVTFPQASLAAGTYKVLIGTSSAAAASTNSGQSITL
jgi:hypothetical protein